MYVTGSLAPLHAVPVARRAPAIAAPAAIADRPLPEDHRDVRLGTRDAMIAAALAARAIYDPRMTGPTETVTSFDRMERVIEGFEHLREIFANIAEQAAEDFGPIASKGTERLDPMAPLLLDRRV
ncbi:MAG: hypothetical protein ACK5IB_04710 [Qingshengfaniella sp.]